MIGFPTGRGPVHKATKATAPTAVESHSKVHDMKGRALHLTRRPSKWVTGDASPLRLDATGLFRTLATVLQFTAPTSP